MNADQFDLRQLRCLVAVAEEGTFTDAAIRLQISQPAVSRALARLEDRLGVRLVERTTRTVALTDAGASFCHEIAAGLARIDDAVLAVRGQILPLRLGYAWAAFGRHTTTILRAWREARPDVVLEVHRVDERLAGVGTGRVDVAVVRGRIENPGLQVERVFTEGRLAALPLGHPLLERVTVTMADLAAAIEPIALTPSVGTTTLDLWPPSARPSASLVVDNIDEWLTVIAVGTAIGLTPVSTSFQHPHPGIDYVAVSDGERLDVNLVWPTVRPHPAVGAFAALVHRCVSARPGSSDGG